MLDSTQSSDGVITKPSGRSVAQTIDGLRRVIADRGFTVFNVIDHRGVAERAGVQMPDSKLVMFGKPAVGAAVMVAAPTTGLKFLLDEAQGTAVSLQFYATAEDMAAGAAALNAMDAGETPGTRVSVDACEIKLERDFA